MISLPNATYEILALVRRYTIIIILLKQQACTCLSADLWRELPAWKASDSWFVPRSGIQVSQKQNVASPLTRKDSILW